MSPRPNAPKKHCWECRRRRLVCDSKQPECGRCHKDGVTCPGYGAKKPLRWLEPGQVAPSSARFWLSPASPVKKRAGQRGITSTDEILFNKRMDWDGPTDEEKWVSLRTFELMPLQMHDVKAVQVMHYCEHAMPSYSNPRSKSLPGRSWHHPLVAISTNPFRHVLCS